MPLITSRFLLEEQTTSVVSRSSNESPEKQVNVKTIVCTSEFSEKLLGLCHKGESIETPKGAKGTHQ